MLGSQLCPKQRCYARIPLLHSQRDHHVTAYFAARKSVSGSRIETAGASLADPVAL